MTVRRLISLAIVASLALVSGTAVGQVDEVARPRTRPVYLRDLEFSPDGKWRRPQADAVRMCHTRIGHVWRTIRLNQTSH